MGMGVGMETTKVLKIVGLILAVGQLVGCKQAERSFSTEEEAEIELSSEEVVEDPEVPGGIIVPPVIVQPAGPTLPVIPKNLSNIPEFCHSFIKASPVDIDMTATNDEYIPGTGSNVTIEKARTLTIDPAGGNIQVRSAITVQPFTSSGGDVSLNALTIKAVTIGGGSEVCLHADQVGAIDATGGGGENTILANKVESLRPGSGQIHIFGGVVKELKDGNYFGLICLHDGAKILNLNNYEMMGFTANGCVRVDRKK